MILVVVAALLCGCSHQSQIVGKWVDVGNNMDTFKQDHTYTFEAATSPPGIEGPWWF
ncbi:MAG: hypothetical protein ACYC96_04840 [Fimbriimonadaceae bacterium]